MRLKRFMIIICIIILFTCFLKFIVDKTHLFVDDKTTYENWWKDKVVYVNKDENLQSANCSCYEGKVVFSKDSKNFYYFDKNKNSWVTFYSCGVDSKDKKENLQICKKKVYLEYVKIYSQTKQKDENSL